MKYNIAVIYGSVRSARKGIRAAEFIMKKCMERGHEVNLVDPLEYDLPLLDKMYKEYRSNDAPASLEKLAQIIKSADAYIVVSGEYNNSMPPALINLMDHFMEEYFFKPSAILSYSAGIFGGVRAAMQLRMFLGEIGTPSIPSIFSIGKVQSAFDEKGNALDDKYDKRVNKFLDELEWYTGALKNARISGTPY